MNKKMKMALLCVLTSVPMLAMAHTGEHTLEGGMAGLMHPLLGLDHLLALIAAGGWLSLYHRSVRSTLGVAFVFALALGTLVGVAFTGSAFEGGIVATLMVLGALLACCARLPVAAGAMLLILVAATHGFVHGAELPAAGVHAFSFGAGLVSSSAAVLLASVLLGLWAQSRRVMIGARAAGVAIALFGVAAAF